MIDTSVAVVSVPMTLAVLLPRFGSVRVPETVAVFDSEAPGSLDGESVPVTWICTL